MLSIDGLQFAYGQDAVLDDVSMNPEPGKIHGVLGPNGSGKTTLLHILAGRLAPDAGTIRWNEESLAHEDIAYLETTPYFYPMITGREYLNLFFRQHSDFKIEKWNEIFGLLLNQSIETYSTGMKKKLALIGVIGLNRPVLLLDEPFNNLDIDSSQLISNILKLLAEKGKTILLTSHVLEMLTSMTDYIYLLEDGKIAETIPKHAFESWKATYRLNEVNAQINKAKDLL